MTDQLTHEGVLILDFGSQFTQLIARRIRELEVYSEIKPCTVKPSGFDLKNVKAVILSGGPASVTDSDAPYFDPGWFELGLPVLGLCYGQQLVAHHFGGRLASGAKREYGRAQVKITDPSSIFSGFNAGEEIQVWMSHGDHVAEIPNGFKSLAISSGSPYAAMENAQRRIYTTQFHPEVAHTLRGKEILGNFIFKIVGLKKNWSAHGFIESTIEQLRAALPQTGQVICALSGGVDSTVAATLVHRAIGSRLHCIFVDNGLLRKDEATKVMKFLGDAGLGLNIKLINARDEFLTELRDVVDPEQKRKTIGRVFIEIFDREAHKISNVTHLVQGTLYPDVIESLSTKGPSATIKSHHNVGGLPERMKLKLIEPLRELFKDEVRRIGAELGIPSDVLKRHPFPGPGLAVRVLGSLDEERLAVLREADQVFQEEVLAAGVYDKLWQSFAVLLPVRSVGVMGDGRTYEQTIALRAVESDDGMTADWAYLPRTLLERVSSRIINEVKGVNRVVLDISTKPPATIEWE